MIDVTRRSSLDAATIFFLKETEVKSMHWIKTNDIILKKQPLLIGTGQKSWTMAQSIQT
jgi:hypothetical protein